MNPKPPARAVAEPYRFAPDAPIPNTLRAPVRARWLVHLQKPCALPELLAEPELTQGPNFILGSGSNVLFTRDFPGTVIHMATRGIEERGHGRVRVAAGESWNGFVRWSLDAGYTGLENLVLIPGTVGAAPVQNIGAYGVELAEFLALVQAWDRARHVLVELDAQDCAFAYRDSLFKHEPGRYVITTVEFALPRARALTLSYAGVREELHAMGVGRPVARDVARAVERLRRRKLPDPGEIGNAGSFFKNPLVSEGELARLRERFPELPAHAYPGGGAKLSAAWLIEQCGLKGSREGDAGLSERHALVLVNYGGATGRELLEFARRVQAHVYERFGITLQPEPLIVPAGGLYS